MLFSVHANALFEMLVSNRVDIFNSPFSHSRIALTSGVLEDYRKRFSEDNTHEMLLEAFVQSLSDRIKAVPSPLSFPQCTVESGYFSAGRMGGRYLVVSNATDLCANAANFLDSIGVRVGLFPHLFEETAIPGYSPFEIHQLVHGNRQAPDSLGRFFKGEDRITVYDKYINEASIDFINFALSLAADSCSIVLLIGGNCAMSAHEITSSVQKRAGQQITVQVVDASTSDYVHDRHIFISGDVEMHFTRGIDCFGRAPAWVNQGSTVSLYDTSLGRDFLFRLRRNGGNAAGRPIRVKSCVIR